MLDIDDRAQLTMADRSGLLARAASYTERWTRAFALGIEAGTRLPRPTEKVIWLHAPRSIQAVARTAARLLSTERTRILLWAPQMAPFQGEGVHVHVHFAKDPRPPIPTDQREHAIFLEGTNHPGETFICLMALMQAWLDQPGVGGPETVLKEDWSLLDACRPEVPSTENPAKQIAQRLSERLPTFWALPPFQDVAQEWRRRYVTYAETQAQWLSADDMRHVDVMVRFPRFWNQATAYVRLGQSNEDPPAWLVGLDQISKRRRTLLLNILAPPALDEAMTTLYLLEMGEWVALYAACLAGVDPADQVARVFMEMYSEPKEDGPE